jgi:hypothetical protein
MTRKEIMDNPAFTLLVDQMDLVKPRLYDVRVDEFEVTSTGIVIVRATLLKDDGSDDRVVNLSKMVKHLKDVNLIFR